MKKVIISIILLLLSFQFISAQTINSMFVVPYYSPDTSVGLAFADILHFKSDKDKYFSALNMFATYTAKHQCTLGIVPSLYFCEGKYLLEAKAIYTNFQRKYYGIGNTTTKDDEEEYINRAHSLGVSLSRKIIKGVMFGVQYDCSDMTIQDTDNNGSLQYNKTNGVISGVGFKLNFDTRNNNIYPTKGCILRANYILYNKRFGSKYNYSVTNFDFRNYFFVYKQSVLFSYQAYGQFINGKAPIQQLSSIGGQTLLRGFRVNRYIDNIGFVLQPEVKFKVSNVVWLALFTGVGNVYKDWEDIDLSKIKTASGVGVRIKVRNNPRTNFRIDFAASNESTGSYFTLMEAF